MITGVATDLLRVSNYFLVYYTLDQDFFSTTTNPHVIITKYALVILWVLFTLRKLIFWYSIIVAQKADTRPWSIQEQIPNSLEDITRQAQQNLKTLEKVAEAYKER